MQVCKPEFELLGISSGSWYHCVIDYERKLVQ